MDAKINKKIELVAKLEEEMVNEDCDLSEERSQVLRHTRQELEEFLFNDSKINLCSKQHILKLFQRMETVVQEVNFENIKLKKEVEILRKNKINLPSMVKQIRMPQFSEVVRSGIAGKEVRPIKANNKIIIKPKEGDKYKDGNGVKDGIFQELKECSKSLKVRGIRRLRDKSVLLELDDEKGLEVVKQKMEKSKNFQTSEPGKIYPRILVYDVSKNVNEHEFIDELVNKNLEEIAGKEDLKKEIKLIFRMGQKDGKCNLVLSVSGRIYNKLQSQGRIFINFDSHRVKEYTSITRCFKCHGFGHTSRVCSKVNPICGHCAQEGHVYKECKNRHLNPVCVNCKNKKKKDDHVTKSLECPEYKKSLEIYKSRICYG